MLIFRDQRVKNPGRGYSTKFYTGRLRPKVQPLTLLYTIFDRKGLSLVYLLLTNGTTFKTYSHTWFRILHPF